LAKNKVASKDHFIKAFGKKEIILKNKCGVIIIFDITMKNYIKKAQN
jgi:hypothetical protein